MFLITASGQREARLARKVSEKTTAEDRCGAAGFAARDPHSESTSTSARAYLEDVEEMVRPTDMRRPCGTPGRGRLAHACGRLSLGRARFAQRFAVFRWRLAVRLLTPILRKMRWTWFLTVNG